MALFNIILVKLSVFIYCLQLDESGNQPLRRLDIPNDIAKIIELNDKNKGNVCLLRHTYWGQDDVPKECTCNFSRLQRLELKCANKELPETNCRERICETCCSLSLSNKFTGEYLDGNLGFPVNCKMRCFNSPLITNITQDSLQFLNDYLLQINDVYHPHINIHKQEACSNSVSYNTTQREGRFVVIFIASPIWKFLCVLFHLLWLKFFLSEYITYKMSEYSDPISIIGLQTILAISSFILCLYACRKINASTSKRTRPDEFYYSPISITAINHNDITNISSKGVRMVMNKVQLPHEKRRFTESSIITDEEKERSLLSKLLNTCSKSSSALSNKLQKSIENSTKSEQFTTNQCINALSYELVAAYGSEKLQQGDVTTLLNNITTIREMNSMEYIEALLYILSLDTIVIKSFTPLTLLTSIILVVTQSTQTNISELLSLLKNSKIGLDKLTSSVLAMTSIRESIDINETDVLNVLDLVRGGLVRRSSRIRRSSK